jgi:chromosome segregation ATPase
MPGPNDTMPCGTETARRRHLAHGVLCHRCNAADRPHVAAYVEQLEAALTEVERERDQARAELAALPDELAEARREAANVRREATRSHRRTEELRAALAELEGRSALLTPLPTTGAAEVEQLRKDLDQLRQRAEAATAALEQLMGHPAIAHQALERVRAYLAGERRSL